MGVSLTLPPTHKKYISDRLFPFFDGLVPEGWLLNQAALNWKISEKDRMGLILNACQSSIGYKKTNELFNLEKEKEVKHSFPRSLISYKKNPLPCLYLPEEAKKIFGSKDFQSGLSFSLSAIDILQKQQASLGHTVTGVQKKLSMELNLQKKSRLTIVDFEGDFILIPPTNNYPNMPEIEHLCMQMARYLGFEVPDCALIPLNSGELAYIVKRFDRNKGKKLYQEDFCQLSGKSTEEKYRSSLEKCGKIIKTYCKETAPNLAMFFDLNLYCFLIGNSDMHLKNFSLVRSERTGEFQLSPLYDLLSTKLLIPEDIEETALAINGKKNKIKRTDWEELAINLSLDPDYFERALQKISKQIPKMLKLIEISYLTKKNKESLTKMIEKNLSTLISSNQ